MRMSLVTSASRMLATRAAHAARPVARAAVARRAAVAAPVALRTFSSSVAAQSGAPVFLEVEPSSLVSFVDKFGPEAVTYSKAIIIQGQERSNVSGDEFKAYFSLIDPEFSFFDKKEVEDFLALWTAKDLSHPKGVEGAQATVHKLVAVWQGLIDREQNRMKQEGDFTNWLDTDLVGIALTVWRAGPYGSKPFIFGPGTDNFIPTAFEQSTGLERLGHVLELIGDKAFDHDALQFPAEFPTKKNPVLVPISETKRVVACRGHPSVGGHLPKYFELSKKGPVHRCSECGSAFKPHYTGLSDESLAFWDLILNGAHGHH